MNSIRRTSRLAAGLAAAAASVLLLAGPAAADTSQASANAADLDLLGIDVFDSGTVTATNDGTGEQTNTSPPVGLLPDFTLLTAGVLAQDATARNDGTSAACAGLVGSGGSLQVGATDPCTANLGTPDGVTLNLGGPLAPATLGADAIYAECTASSTGAPTGTAHLVNLELNGEPLVVTGGVNQSIVVTGLASVVVNEQTVNPDGSITVRALHVILVPALVPGGEPLSELIIGEVTCGPNAVTPPISIFAGPALPVAAAGAAVVGALFFVQRRRRTLA